MTGATTPDSEVSLNGGTFADCTNEMVEIATNSGVYYLLLTGAEMTADVVTVILKSATAGMKTSVVVLYPRKLVSIRAGTSASGGSLTASIVLDASASAVDDFYNGMLCVAVIDTLTEARMISDYTGSTQTATVVPDWNVAPDNNDTFTIYRPDGVQMQQANVSHWNSLATVALPLVPATAGRSLVVDSAGLADANAVKVGPTASGTAQTARDLGASVLLSAGTGTGQLDFTSGVVKANLAQILGTALTETAGLLAAGFKKFFNVTSPTGTVNSLADAVPGTAGGGFIAGTNAATTVTTALTTTFTGNLTGSVASVSGAVGSVTGAVGSVASGGISAASIAADAITAAKIADGAIDAATFAAGAIDATAIAADAITAAKVADGAIDAATFAASAITATAIASNAITAAKIAADAITAAKIADGAIDAATFAAGAIDATAIASNAITAAKIADGAIDAATFAAGAIDATAIAANAIGASELAADAVAEIADQVWDEVLSDHLTSGTTGAALNGAGAAGDPWGTALPGAYGAGTAGKIIGDNVNATISSRSTLTAAQANTEADTALADVGLTGTITGRIDAAVSTRATPAQVNTEVLDCLVTDTHAEASAVPAATSSLKDKICWLFMLARNRLQQTSSTQALRNDGNSSSVATSAVSDDGVTAVRDKWT